MDGRDATHTAVRDTSETDTVEGSNADVRHDLARVVRTSRCFSRCSKALRRAVHLCVWWYNQRQLWQQRYPHYRKHSIDVVPP